MKRKVVEFRGEQYAVVPNGGKVPTLKPIDSKIAAARAARRYASLVMLNAIRQIQGGRALDAVTTMQGAIALNTRTWVREGR